LPPGPTSLGFAQVASTQISPGVQSFAPSQALRHWRSTAQICPAGQSVVRSQSRSLWSWQTLPSPSLRTQRAPPVQSRSESHCWWQSWNAQISGALQSLASVQPPPRSALGASEPHAAATQAARPSVTKSLAWRRRAMARPV
jgi:hypothetical protein